MITLERIKKPGPFAVCDSCLDIATYRLKAEPPTGITARILFCDVCRYDIKTLFELDEKGELE